MLDLAGEFAVRGGGPPVEIIAVDLRLEGLRMTDSAVPEGGDRERLRGEDLVLDLEGLP